MDEQLTAAQLSILYALWSGASPLTVGAIADRANARDHQVVTLLTRLCREDLVYRVPVNSADWPPSGRFRFTAAGRRWAARVISEQEAAGHEPAGHVEPAEPVDAGPGSPVRSVELNAKMREAILRSDPTGLVPSGARTEDALIRRGLAEPVFADRLARGSGKVVSCRIGARLNPAGLARREALRERYPLDAQRRNA